MTEEVATYIAIPIHFKVMPHHNKKLSRAEARQCIKEMIANDNLQLMEHDIAAPFVQIHCHGQGICDIALSMDEDEEE